MSLQTARPRILRSAPNALPCWRHSNTADGRFGARENPPTRNASREFADTCRLLLRRYQYVIYEIHRTIGPVVLCDDNPTVDHGNAFRTILEVQRVARERRLVACRKRIDVNRGARDDMVLPQSLLLSRGHARNRASWQLTERSVGRYNDGVFARSLRHDSRPDTSRGKQ